jgi:hypothetical protein
MRLYSNVQPSRSAKSLSTKGSRILSHNAPVKHSLPSFPLSTHTTSAADPIANHQVSTECEWVEFSNVNSVSISASSSFHQDKSKANKCEFVPAKGIITSSTYSTSSCSDSESSKHSLELLFPQPCHFDIEVVKMMDRDNYVDDNLSNNTSSTISTRSLAGQSKSHIKSVSSARSVFEAFPSHSSMKNFMTKASFTRGGWTSPHFFETVPSTINSEDCGVSWTTFTPTSFTPIEQAPRSKCCTTLLNPETKRAGLTRKFRTRNMVSRFDEKRNNDTRMTVVVPMTPPTECKYKPLTSPTRKILKNASNDTGSLSVSHTSNLDGILNRMSLPNVSNKVIKSGSVHRKVPKGTSFLDATFESKKGSHAKPKPSMQTHVKPTTKSKNGTCQGKTNHDKSNQTSLAISSTPSITTKIKTVIDSSQSKASSSITLPICLDDVNNNVPLDELSDGELILELNKNPDYIKYSKMSKVGLRIAAIRNALQRDGIVIMTSTTSTCSNCMDKSPLQVHDPIQRVRIPWSPHKNARTNTVWAMIQREQHWLASIAIDEHDMTTIFQKVKKIPKQSNLCNNNMTDKYKNTKHTISIDSKRANNCGIILASIKLSYHEIACAIDTMNINTLSLLQIQSLIDYIPNVDETKAIQRQLDQHRTSNDCNSSDVSKSPFYTECEKFMVEMMYINDTKRKMESMLFMKRLPDCLVELTNGMFCNSVKERTLL